MRAYLIPLAVLMLAGCSQHAAQTADSGDKFSGFQPELVAWRAAIEAESPVCKSKVDGKGCQDFTVACKRERAVTAEETAHGVTAKLVAAMTYASRGADGKPGSAVAEFTHAKDGWTRADTGPVNMSTCEAAPHA